MPSTYSPSLKLELIGNGEQAGTWGNTTNSNLGALLEQAITGVTTVDVTSSNMVLTSFNGVVDQARSATLIFTGTPGVARTVTVPNVSKSYFVYNNSDSTVSIITSGGGSFAVSANGYALVTCTGASSFYATAIAPLASPAFTGTPTAPTAATPTNTTQLATTAFVQAAIAGSVTPPFPAGTAVIFAQSTAPTGWTKVTAYNDAALRVVSGSVSSGGSTAFSTVFAAGGFATNSISLTTAQLANHSHGISPNNNINYSRGQFDPTGLAFQTNEVGGPTLSISAAGSNDTHYHTTVMPLKYVDVIIATKN